MKTAEEALKYALVLSIIAPDEYAAQALEIAVRAAALVDDATLERVKGEIEAMSDDELPEWFERYLTADRGNN